MLPAGRAALLRACLPTTLEVAPEAAAAGAAAKGSYGQGIGEELVVWVSAARRSSRVAWHLAALTQTSHAWRAAVVCAHLVVP